MTLNFCSLELKAMWPYHAKVMNTFESTSSAIVAIPFTSIIFFCVDLGGKGKQKYRFVSLLVAINICNLT